MLGAAKDDSINIATRTIKLRTADEPATLSTDRFYTFTWIFDRKRKDFGRFTSNGSSPFSASDRIRGATFATPVEKAR